MRKLISLVLVVAVFFAGCAGREANPVPAYMPGDENRSCTALKAEVAQLQVDMQRLLPKTDKGLTNALWATAGVFFIVPFFFMDLKDAEKIEFDAMRQRHNRLLVYAAEKGCDFGEVRAERILSIKERKAAAKKAKKQAEALDSNVAKVGDAALSVDSKAATDNITQLSCANCGEKIGKLEEPNLFKGHIVCVTCYKKLINQ